MSDETLDFWASKPSIDPDRVKCDECGAVEPIERMAEVSITDRTPERAMGGGSVAVLHYCPACFGKKLGLGTVSPSPRPTV